MVDLVISLALPIVEYLQEFLIQAIRVIVQNYVVIGVLHVFVDLISDVIHADVPCLVFVSVLDDVEHVSMP